MEEMHGAGYQEESQSFHAPSRHTTLNFIFGGFHGGFITQQQLIKSLALAIEPNLQSIYPPQRLGVGSRGRGLGH